jgi:niacin transporter
VRGTESGRIPTATLTGTALLLALGVVLPIVFHAIPLGGRVFLPMHLPAFVAGLMLGPAAGLVVGAGSPVLSALLTGRPTVFYMIPMILEMATYGLVSGLLRVKLEAVRKRLAAGDYGSIRARSGSASPWTTVWLALVCAMVAGRLVWIATVVWLAPVIGLEARTVAMALGALGAGWVGMIIQLAIIPPIVRAIERARGT